MTDPLELEARRQALLDRLRALRSGIADLSAEYSMLPTAGLLLDTEGIGALTTPDYCAAGAREVFEEAVIELDAATDAITRAGAYTSRLRLAALD
ncbi:hypothetical protein [Nocardia sp. NPDC052566]|uniref:hypothetical protein n=1 Tax=Nocardia sp. NPDC052566 TaxID=3364330 RepID=UPI0037C71DBD